MSSYIPGMPEQLAADPNYPQTKKMPSIQLSDGHMVPLPAQPADPTTALTPQAATGAGWYPGWGWGWTNDPGVAGMPPPATTSSPIPPPNLPNSGFGWVPNWGSGGTSGSWAYFPRQQMFPGASIS